VWALVWGLRVGCLLILGHTLLAYNFRYLPQTPGAKLQKQRWEAGGALACLLLVTLSPLAQRLLASRLCHYLGRVSFSLYLWHTPVLLTLGAWSFLRLYADGRGRLGYLPAAGVVYVISLIVSMAVSHVSTRVLDEGAVRLGQGVFKVMFGDYDPAFTPHRLARSAQEWGCRRGGRVWGLLVEGGVVASLSPREKVAAGDVELGPLMEPAEAGSAAEGEGVVILKTQ
jgi:peptidoglycan/LPS O-acetylase OafA/YrhL